MIKAIANIFWRKKDNHFCRKFNMRSSTLLLAFLLLVLHSRWRFTCARLIRFGDGSGICTSSGSGNMRRTTEGKPGSITLELVELCRVIEYGSIHLGTIRVSRYPTWRSIFIWCHVRYPGRWNSDYGWHLVWSAQFGVYFVNFDSHNFITFNHLGPWFYVLHRIHLVLWPTLIKAKLVTFCTRRKFEESQNFQYQWLFLTGREFTSSMTYALPVRNAQSRERDYRARTFYRSTLEQCIETISKIRWIAVCFITALRIIQPLVLPELRATTSSVFSNRWYRISFTLNLIYLQYVSAKTPNKIYLDVIKLIIRISHFFTHHDAHLNTEPRHHLFPARIVM